MENARELHVSEALGISLGELGQNWISEEAARKIKNKYPQLHDVEIEGEAFDSLFRQMCGSQMIIHDGKAIAAPFAFVSVLAGAVLAAMFVNYFGGGIAPDFNHWRISPWTRPIAALKSSLPQRADCEVCSDSIYLEVRHELWG